MAAGRISSCTPLHFSGRVSRASARDSASSLASSRAEKDRKPARSSYGSRSKRTTELAEEASALLQVVVVRCRPLSLRKSIDLCVYGLLRTHVFVDIRSPQSVLETWDRKWDK